MIRRLALLAIAVVLLSALPASAITTGHRDRGEHPYVGELIFFDADCIDDRFDDPGGWFTCSDDAQLHRDPAGHCTYGVGLDGESTTRRGGDGSGGNDIWFDHSEVAHFDGFPDSSDYDRDENQQRYEDRAAL